MATALEFKPDPKYYEFCQAFLKATDDEWNVALKNESTTSKIGQGIVTSLSAAVGLAAGNSRAGLGTAKVLNVVIAQVDKISQENKRLSLEQAVDAKSVREFEKCFRILMLNSAIEIWYAYENQLKAVHHKVTPKVTKMTKKIEKVGQYTTQLFSTTKEEDEKLESRDPNISYGIRKLAQFAGSSCVAMMIEQESNSCPHESVSDPDFFQKLKSKYTQLVIEGVTMKWTEDFSEEKTAAVFFQGPTPAFGVVSSVQNSTDLKKNSTKVRLTRRSREKLVKTKIPDQLRKSLKNPDITLPLQLRRPFDFEQKQIENIQESKLLIVDLQTNIEDYFVWMDHSEEAVLIYDQLKEDGSLGNEELMLSQFRKILIQMTDTMQNQMTLIEEIREQINNLAKRGINSLHEKLDNIFNAVTQSNEKTHVTHFNYYDPPPKNFTGRENDLNIIHNLVSSAKLATEMEKKIVVISGIGGLGKSSVASKYAQMYQKYHENIFKLDAESKTSLTASFVNLGRKLKIEIPHGLQTNSNEWADHDVQFLLSTIFEHISIHVGHSLLIFDNAYQMQTGGTGEDEDFGIIEFLPWDDNLAIRPVILITSRRADWATISVVPLGFLNEEWSLEFLRKALIQNTSKDVDKNKNLNSDPRTNEALLMLNGILNGYPLALTLAASNIFQSLQLKNWSAGRNVEDFVVEIEAYLENYQEDFRTWQCQTMGSSMVNKYQQTIAKVMMATMKKLKREAEEETQLASVSELAIKLLHTLAFHPQDKIPLKLCYCILENVHVTESYMEAFRPRDMRKIEQALGKLENYSIATRFDMGLFPDPLKPFEFVCLTRDYVRVHRVIKKWAKESVVNATNIWFNTEHLIHGVNFYCVNPTIDASSNQCFEYLKELKRIKWIHKTYRPYIDLIVRKESIYSYRHRDWLDLLKNVYTHLKNEIGEDKDPEYFSLCRLGILVIHHEIMGYNNTKKQLEDELDYTDVFLNSDPFHKITVKNLIHWIMDRMIEYKDNELFHQSSRTLMEYIWIFIHEEDYVGISNELIHWCLGYGKLFKTEKINLNGFHLWILSNVIITQKWHGDARDEIVDLILPTAHQVFKEPLLGDDYDKDALRYVEMFWKLYIWRFHPLIDYDQSSILWKHERELRMKIGNSGGLEYLVNVFFKCVQEPDLYNIYVLRNLLPILVSFSYEAEFSPKMLKSAGFFQSLRDLYKMKFRSAVGIQNVKDEDFQLLMLHGITLGFALFTSDQNIRDPLFSTFLEDLKNMTEYSISSWRPKTMDVIEHSSVFISRLNECEEVVNQFLRHHHESTTKEAYKIAHKVKETIFGFTSSEMEDGRNGFEYHDGVQCDGCDAYPIHRIRFQCKSCEEFDFCQECKETREHEHNDFVEFDRTLVLLDSKMKVTK